MKKIISQYNAQLISITMVITLIIAMISDGTNSLLYKWISLSVLWGIALLYLKKPANYYSILKDKVFIAYLFFVVWAIFSSLFLSTAKSISILGLMPFIGGILSYFIAFNSHDKKDSIFDLLLLGFGLFLVIYTGYQKMALDLPRPYGLLSNWNSHAAILAIIILPWVLHYALKPSTHLSQLIIICFLSLLFSFAMGLTLSRGALLIIITAIFGLILFAWRQKLFFKHSLGLLTALILGYFLSSLLFDENIVNRLSSISKSNSLVSLGSGRHLLWLPAWQMFLDNPLTGWGLGTFRFLYLQYKPPLSGEAGTFVHNDYLQFLLELGPIGLGIFIVFIFILLKRLSTIIFIQSNKSDDKIKAFVFLIIPLGLLIHTFLTFNLYHFSTQILFTYYLGRSSRHFFNTNDISTQTIEPNPKYSLYYSSFTTLVILLITSFGLTIFFLQQANHSTNEQEKLDYFWKASLFFPAIDRYNSYNASLLTTHIQNTQNQSQQEQQKIIDHALSEVNRAINKMPFNTKNYMTKASLLKQANQNPSVIIEQYEKALTKTPSALDIRYKYTHYLIEQKQYKKALSILWSAWNRITVDRYQIGIQYLTYQLEINQLYGKKQDNQMIENEIQRLKIINKTKEGGVYVFKKIYPQTS